MIRDELHYRANTISYTHKKYVLLDGNLPYICTVTEIPCTIHITNDETLHSSQAFSTHNAYK